MSDYHGASPWFSAVSTPATLRPGPYTAALQASQFVRTWCDGCGRRRAADGRCPVCDPWWTSPFYVYGSLLTVGVTALLLTITSLLRASSPNVLAAVPDGPTVSVLVVSPPFAGADLSAGQVAAPPVVLYRRPLYIVPAAPVALPMPPQAADAGLADLARLRAMTDYAAGMETRRDATRTWSGIPSQNVVPVPIVQYPRPTTVPVSPTGGAPPFTPTLPVSPGTEALGASREGVTPSDSAPATTSPQRTL